MSQQDECWFESWFDSHYYHILYKHRDHREAEKFLSLLIEHCGITGGTVWDMACGKGRHARYLAARGLDVIASDLSEASIEEATAYCTQNLQFFVHDMRMPIRINYFDYVMNLFTSFGYFESDRENRHVITSAFKALKPGGTFILDFLNPARVKNDLVPEQYIESEGINFTIRKQIIDNLVLKKIEVSDGDCTPVYEEKVKLYEPHQLELMLKESGFTVSQIFGGYHLEEFNNESERMIFIARK